MSDIQSEKKHLDSVQAAAFATGTLYRDDAYRTWLREATDDFILGKPLERIIEDFEQRFKGYGRT